MDNQNNISNWQDGKNYFKKAIIFTAIILILIAIVVFFDFMVKWTKPSGSATLSWNANTESDLAGYKIYYGASPRTGDCPAGGYSKNLDAGKTATPDKPSYKVDNLKENKTYYFSVISYDTSGNESCFSPEMSKSIISNLDSIKIKN